MPKRPVAVILLQIALASASIVLAIVTWRVNSNPDWTPEQQVGVRESTLRLIATILLFLGTFIALWFRKAVAKILTVISLGWLSYSTVSIVTNFGEDDKSDLYAMGFEDLSYGNIGTFIFFIVWFYVLLLSKPCQEFFETKLR